LSHDARSASGGGAGVLTGFFGPVGLGFEPVRARGFFGPVAPDFFFVRTVSDSGGVLD